MKPQERSRQNGSGFLPSLQSLSGLYCSIRALMNLRASARWEELPVQHSESPQATGQLWEPGRVNRPATRTAFVLEGPAWATAQRQGSPEDAQGVEHRRNEEEEWEARREGQGLCQELRLVLGDQRGPSPPHLTSPACLANVDLWDCWWGQQWRWRMGEVGKRKRRFVTSNSSRIPRMF